REHEQPEVHCPHAILIHLPPTSAVAGNGHDMPPTSNHPVAGIQGHAGKHSFRHGRSVTEHRPNCCFVPCQSTSVAIISASAMISGSASSGYFAHSTGHASHGPVSSAAIMPILPDV